MKTPTLRAVLGISIGLAFASLAGAGDSYYNLNWDGTNGICRVMTPSATRGQAPAMSSNVVLNASQKAKIRALWQVPALGLEGEPIFTCVRTTNGVPANLNFRLSKAEARFFFTLDPAGLAAASNLVSSLQVQP